MARISQQITAHNFNVTSSHGELVAQSTPNENVRSPLPSTILKPPSLVGTPASSTLGTSRTIPTSSPPSPRSRPASFHAAEWRMHTEIEGYFNDEEDKKQLELLLASMRQDLPACKHIWADDKAEPQPDVVSKEAVLLDRALSRLIHPHSVPQRCYEAFQHYSNGGYVSTTQLMQLLSDCGLHITHSHTRELIAIVDDKMLWDSLNFQEFFIIFNALTIFQLVLAQNEASTETTPAAITPAHVRARLRQAGFYADEKTILSMMGEAKLTQDGTIHFYEFLKMYFDQMKQKSRIQPDVEFFTTWYQRCRERKRQAITPREDLIAGTCAGIAICLVGHPFDTVKVRMQTSPTAWFSSGLDCAIQTIGKESPLALYKGMGGPLSTVPAINALVFASYGKAISMIRSEDDTPISVPSTALCGGFAGLLQSVIVSPIEMVKSRLQIQFARPRESLFKGPLDCLVKVWKTQGVRGVFKGMSATVYREVPGYAAQFGAYEGMKRLLTPEGQETNTPTLLLCGGMSGICAWMCSYPQDYIKSQLQTEDISRKSKFIKNRWLLDGGFFDCGRKIVRQHGFERLWLGIGPCLARAFPANAAGFFAYEYTVDWLKQQKLQRNNAA